MSEKRTSVLSNGLIWFGAAVSMAEILTGTYFAPLGFAKGMLANVIGHIIGCFLLFLAGLIGARTNKSSMETVKMSFGYKGSYLFVVLNVLQLAGWTAIMIYDASLAANGIVNTSAWVWCLVIGALIIVWIVVGISNLGKLNTIAVVALFILSLVLSKIIFFQETVSFVPNDTLSFGAAVELAVAMPISWLTLISDYTRKAKKPYKATLASCVVYGMVSCWMYAIGMGAAIFTGEYDIAKIMMRAGLGIAGLLIIIISTVTTTFLDAYSAGVSAESITKKINGKWAAVIVSLIGIAAAMFYPMDDITNFLYLIGSVFAPMIAIQVADYFILKKEYSKSAINSRNLMIWFVGFVLYRVLINIDIVVGNTLPDIAITIVICILCDKIFFNPKKA